MNPKDIDNFNEIMNQAKVGMLLVDGNGFIVWGNHYYESLTKLKIVHWIGKYIAEISNAGEVQLLQSELLWDVVQRTKDSVDRIVSYKTNDTIITTATPIFNSEGQIIWTLYVLTDCDEVSKMRRELINTIEKNNALKKLVQETSLRELESQNIIVNDNAMKHIYATALRIALVDTSLMILGESGVGKDVLAKFVHQSSNRKNGNFVHVNLGAIPETLFESELFGYEAGAFTGATKTGRVGLIEIADNGTLFLDEIGELPLNMQVKLLQFIQNKTITRIGGNKEIHVNVRIICATNRDLEQMIKENKFRRDLYYRLNVLELRIPPLRERKNDILLLVKHFTNQFNDTYKYNKTISTEVMNCFLEYSWPGNIRELRHLVERLIIINQEDSICLEHLPKEFSDKVEYDIEEENVLHNHIPLKNIMEKVEADIIRKAIDKTPTIIEAAKVLGIEVSTLTKKKQKYNIYKRQSSCSN